MSFETVSYLFPMLPPLDSSLSQVITDLGGSLSREWSKKPILADFLPSFTCTLTSPFHGEALWNCPATGNWLLVRRSESPGEQWWLPYEGDPCFPLHKCRYCLWFCKNILVTCGFGVTVWWLLHFDCSANQNRANRRRAESKLLV